jgi:two-component system, LytTR family, response regulator
MKIRVLIVDDEPWARRRIATLLKGESDIDVVGECSDGADAICKISELSPDIVFLDVQMPDVSGFEVIEALDSDRMPLVVFATAYDKYAVQAFDAHALDYLLKPFDEERFCKALNRARRDLQHEGTSQQTLISLLDRLREGYLQRLVVKSGARIVFLKAAEIDWFEAAGNYVAIHVGRETHLLRTTMNVLEPKLDPQQFIRIQRSAIVNLDRIKALLPWKGGEQILMLKDGTELTLGRMFRRKLEGFLQNTLTRSSQHTGGTSM